MDTDHVAEVLSALGVDVDDDEVFEILWENWGEDMADMDEDEAISFLYNELS